MPSEETTTRTGPLTGSGWTAELSVSHSLSSALFAAAIIAAKNEAAAPLDQEVLRIMHNISDDGTHEILVIKEGWKA